jgi:hypothetical protein
MLGNPEKYFEILDDYLSKPDGEKNSTSGSPKNGDEELPQMQLPQMELPQMQLPQMELPKQ